MKKKGVETFGALFCSSWHFRQNPESGLFKNANSSFVFFRPRIKLR